MSASDFRSSGSAPSWRRPLALIARAEAHYALLDLPPMKAAAAVQALALKLGQLSPFARTEFVARRLGQQAQVWYWDATAWRERARQAGRDDDRFFPVCESALMPAPASDGPRLLQCERGVDLQYWRGGVLKRSRWCAQPPEAASWRSFVRDCGLTDDMPMPAPQRLAADPAAARDLLAGPRAASAVLSGAALGMWLAVAVLAGASAWQAAAHLRLTQRTDAARTALAALGDAHREASRAQARADALRQRVEALSALLPAHRQTLLLAHLSAAGLLAVEQGVVLAEWDFRNGKLRLQFDVLNDDFQLTNFLNRLERVEALRNIRLLPEATPRQFAISADIDAERLRQLPAAAASAAGEGKRS